VDNYPFFNNHQLTKATRHTPPAALNTMVGNSPEIIYRPGCGAKSGADFAGVLGVGESDSL